MKEILAAADATPSDIVKTTILLEDIADFVKVNEMYKAFFGDGRVPARYLLVSTHDLQHPLCTIRY